ncbi:MAG: MBL fold metallo-hydrolase [Firmicutes bacterium]|nr:MBL fold metallo-hydrolase [Bacillota bacterium]
MYELVMLTDRSGYIECPAKMGVFVSEPGKAVLIDAGSDKDAGKKAIKALDGAGLALQAVINTHLHADHIGGNKLLANRTEAPIYGPSIVSAVAEHPVLEPSLLWGGCPPKQLRNKFLMAESSAVKPIAETDLQALGGLEVLQLGGHSMDMIGLRTPDNVVYLADCVFSEETTQKYHVNFQYDVAKAFETLDYVETLEADWFVPAHAAPCKDIKPLVAANRAKMLEVADLLLSLCKEGACFEDILANVFTHYGLDMNVGQHALVGSTTRSYLAYLADSGRITLEIQDNHLIFKAV